MIRIFALLTALLLPLAAPAQTADVSLLPGWRESGGTHVAGLQKCWNWFRTKHQGRNFGEPAIIAGMTETVTMDLGIPTRAVIVAGFSAGAAMALILRDAYSDVFFGTVAHSGVATGVARNGVAALSAMKGEGSTDVTDHAHRPLLIIQGDKDEVVDPSNAARIEKDDPFARVKTVKGLGHAWSGGTKGEEFSDHSKPSASHWVMEMALETERETLESARKDLDSQRRGLASERDDLASARKELASQRAELASEREEMSNKRSRPARIETRMGG